MWAPECGGWPEWVSLLFLAPTSHGLPAGTAPAPSCYQGDYPIPFDSPAGGLTEVLATLRPRGGEWNGIE